jgi:hypothetical protein
MEFSLLRIIQGLLPSFSRRNTAAVAAERAEADTEGVVAPAVAGQEVAALAAAPEVELAVGQAEARVEPGVEPAAPVAARAGQEAAPVLAARTPILPTIRRDRLFRRFLRRLQPINK